jgi:hypothetical protein
MQRKVVVFILLIMKTQIIKEKQCLVRLKKKFERVAAIEEKGKAVIEKRDRLQWLACA